MKQATLILVFLFSYFLVNCSSSEQNSQQSGNSPEEVIAPEILAVSCEAEVRDYQERVGSALPHMQKQITLHQVKQKVLRKDCNGQPLSEDIEIVDAPSADVFLRPRESSVDIVSVHLLQPKNCATADTVLPNHHYPTGVHAKINGDQNGRIRLRVNLLQDDFVFQVTEGANTIYFTYTRPNKYGKYELYVTRTEETLPDVKVVEAEGCSL